MRSITAKARNEPNNNTDRTSPFTSKCANAQTLTPASIGRGAGQEVREGVRGDRIQWLDAGLSPACDHYLALMDGLRQALNRELYLGLDDYECHFALYPPGAFYQKHLDRFRDDDRRAVSAVFYLNPDWQPEQGGALRIVGGTSLQVLVQGLNRMGLKPQGIIAILQAIKTSGALQADLVVQ